MRSASDVVVAVEVGVLESLGELGAISALDTNFGQTVQRLSATDDLLIGLSAALASRAVQAGHVCLPMDGEGSRQLVASDDTTVQLELPGAKEWRRRLLASSLCTEHTGQDAVSHRHALLVLGNDLYLQRYARYQQRLVAALRPRLRAEQVDGELLRDSLGRLFPQQSDQTDWQRVAGVLAATRNFCLISGGPGTGKTTTVAKVLVMLLEQLGNADQLPRIALLAPTGKAAQRLSESLAASVSGIQTTERIKAHLHIDATTIHRALGYQPRTPTRFYHNLARPLPADIVLIDEASMVDLALMTKLFEAVPQQSRIILLGDKDQLASVEAGAILGDLFNENAGLSYSAQTADEVLELTQDVVPRSPAAFGPRDCMAHLQKSYRYRAGGGIGQLARAIHSADLIAFRRASEEPGVVWRTEDTLTLESLRGSVQEGYGALSVASTPTEKLAALNNFRLLAAHRRGPNGVQLLNQWAEMLLAPAGRRSVDSQYMYDGRPIIVTQNDYGTELFNGDVGVLHRDKDTRRLYAYFGSPTSPKRVPASRLPPHETAYAMTVHKSQGTEFRSVCLVCPARTSPIFTRELLYTGITRGREFVEVIGSEAVVSAALSTRVQRASGIKQAIWSP